MKYALIFRGLYIDGRYYFQSINKLKGSINKDNRFISEEENNLGLESIALIGNKEKYGYVELTEDEFLNIPAEQSVFLKLEDGTLNTIDDYTEQANVMLEFQKTYKDFPIVPDFDIEDKINDVRVDLKSKLLGQDEPINKLLNKIYNNQMFIETDLDSNDIRHHKSNILLVGPFGTGKSTIKESIKDNLHPVPVIEYSLTGDYSVDVANIINKLLFASDGNKYLAERGIVIFDGINHYNSIDGDNRLDSLKDILQDRIVYGARREEVNGETKSKIFAFDFSLLTFMCIVDVDYDYQDDAVYDNTYYSKIDGTKLLELGFTINMLSDLFGSEVIYMNEITPRLAFNILKDKDKSPLYKQKMVLENRGKRVRISKDFVDYLIQYGLDLNEGMEGIIKTINVILENKDLSLKQINFTEKDLKGLMISAAIPEDIEEKSQTKSKGKDKFKYDLKVDLIKRTINDLTINDTVNIMKKTIKGQDKQLFYFVNAFYNHVFNQNKDYTKAELKELKENVLLFGPAGSGKTTILETLSSIFDIPFVIADATEYSKVGYVGADVNSILLNLIDAADGNIRKAEHGIIFVDEFDKIARGNSDRTDSMDKGVQNGLLKIFEGGKRTITKRDEGDIVGSEIQFDTSNLFIAASGAYDGLDKITEARLKKELGLDRLGFRTSETKCIDLTPNDADLKEYGHDFQMLGRLPNKIMLNNLDINALCEIINNKDGGFVHLKLENYKSSGINVKISDEFKLALAKKALEKKTGARALKSVFSDLTKEIDFNIQNGDIEEVILDEKSIEEPNKITYVKRKKK